MTKANIPTDPNCIQGYLKRQSERRKQEDFPRQRDAYHNMFDFILDNGRSYEDIADRPKGFRSGAPNYCFSNCARLIFDRPDWKLTYVEGIARYETAFVYHAWCADEKNRILEVTWDRTWKPGERDYFGVPIKENYMRMLWECKVAEACVIQAKSIGFPLLTGKHAAFYAVKGLKGP